MTSRDSGARTTRAQSASISTFSTSTAGWSAATSSTTSSQNGIVWMIPFDLVADTQAALPLLGETEGLARDPLDPAPGEDRLLGRPARSAARVHPPADLRVLALDVLAHDDDVDRRVRRRAGSVRPAERIGRRLTYWSNARRIGISRPQSDTWSGTPGAPTAPRKIAS